MAPLLPITSWHATFDTQRLTNLLRKSSTVSDALTKSTETNWFDCANPSQECVTFRLQIQWKHRKLSLLAHVNLLKNLKSCLSNEHCSSQKAVLESLDKCFLLKVAPERCFVLSTKPYVTCT